MHDRILYENLKNLTGS